MAERLIYDDAGTLKDVSVANPFPVQIGGSGGGGVVTVGGTAASGATATGNPVQVGGVYHTTAPTLTDGKANVFELDSSGNQQVNLNKLIAGEDLTNGVLKTERQYSFTHISTATTTVVKAAAGFLSSITVNTTTANTITIYNNTAASGAVIAVLKASVAEQTFFFECVCSIGITVVTAGASDVTVTYR